MIIKKILRLELIFLSLISLCCLFFVLFNLENTDNYFSISSGSELSIISYYLTSLLAGVYFYIGPWIVFSLIFFSLFYFKVLRQRVNNFDPLLVVSLSVGLFGVFYLCMPSLLGAWLGALSAYAIGEPIAWLCILLSLIFCLSIIFEKKPHRIIMSFLKLIKFAFIKARNFVVDNFRSVRTKFQNSKKSSEKASVLRASVKDPIEKEVYKPQIVKTEKATTKLTEDLDVEVQVDLNTEVFENNSSMVIATDSVEPRAEEVEESTDESVIYKSKPLKMTPSFASEDLIATLEPEEGGYEYEHPDDKYFREITEKLEEKLIEFKIDCKIISVLKGPVVDTFEIELGSGVRVSKINTIQDDLSLALSGAPIRVVYPMKGRTTIGIEVPRNPREVILLDEVLKSELFSDTKAKLPICMGKDAFGDVFIVDLAKMPHMLVAGATGAGKSVFINTLLVSLLVKMNHKKLKLILVDPKQLELAQYAKLPHLCLPVVTEPGIAAASLMWAVEEMERRYTLLKDLGVRNLEGFNAKIKRASSEQLGQIHHHYPDSGDGGFELPYIVIVIDEFADLILTKQGKEIETSVCRLAAKARAAGIHIVLATQIPSVDVITGLIKNNFPTRVSFRVTSNMDSKTILTATGAEKLLGMGDMLYKHGVEMNRVHSAYVGEEEVDLLCEKLEGIPQDYNAAAMEFLENQEKASQAEAITAEMPEMGRDALFDQAVAIVVESRGASASMLQRRLRIGYNRAANLIDQLEIEGVVGPSNGSKPRDILSSGVEE